MQMSCAIGLASAMLSVVITNVVGGEKKMGPYDVIIEKLEPCEDQGSAKIVFPTKMNSAGKGKKFYDESVKLDVPFDENFKMNVEVQKWGNGGWRPKAFQYKVKNCNDIWKLAGKDLLEVLKSAKSNVTGCPVPAGNYKVDNWMLNLDLGKNVPVMEYGKYRGIFKMYYAKEFVGCIIGYGECAPKDV